ncbi:MAG: galactokinase family protein [Clostridia bacterium]|nr:galactokinase family protein [Clostridia bacterium]
MDISAVFARNQEKLDALYGGVDQKERYTRLADAYHANFGGECELFVSAPGRAEVVGNHTDHNRGRVLAASVNLDSVAAVADNHSNRVCLFSEGYDQPFIVNLNDLEVFEDEKNTTSALIRGVAARLKQLGYKIGGFNAQVTSTVFKGSGLSSSAAFEVMLVAAFDALFNGWVIDAKENARISQYAENVYFGKPCGLLDQTASAVGGLVALDFAPEIASVEAMTYDFKSKGYAVCVVSAGGDHGDLTDAYASITIEMHQVAQAMGVDVLAKVAPDQLMEALPKLKNQVPDRAILRAFHFVDETRRVSDAIDALRRDDLNAFFNAVIESGESSWKLLQNLHAEGSENQEMPLACEISRRMLRGRGAWRIHGGGFAGTILAFVPLDMLDRYASVMDGVFGKGATTVLSIRPQGVVCIR